MSELVHERLEVDFVAALLVDAHTEELHVAIMIRRPGMTCAAPVVDADFRTDPARAIALPAKFDEDFWDGVAQGACVGVLLSNVETKGGFSPRGGGEVSVVKVERFQFPAESVAEASRDTLGERRGDDLRENIDHFFFAEFPFAEELVVD